LNRIFINLREYVSSKQALFLSTAVTELTQVAISHDESQPLNPAQWQLVNGEYSINLNAPTPAADAEQKPPSNAALNSDSCANLNPTLDQMRQRLITTLF
jgi:hypothetical protein